jgi:hypothetical protein
MPHLLKFTASIVSARAGLHTDQARRALCEKGDKLAAADLTTDKNSPNIVDTMDLEDVLCQVNSNGSKLRHGRLLDWGQRLPNYAGSRRRKQVPSTPSIKNAWRCLRQNNLAFTVFNDDQTILGKCSEAWNFFANDKPVVASVTKRAWAEVWVRADGMRIRSRCPGDFRAPFGIVRLGQPASRDLLRESIIHK